MKMEGPEAWKNAKKVLKERILPQLKTSPKGFISAASAGITTIGLMSSAAAAPSSKPDVKKEEPRVEEKVGRTDPPKVPKSIENLLEKHKGKEVTFDFSKEALSETAIECLALNVYHEARGQSEKGWLAVALVTLGRALPEYKKFPKDVCGVVYQDKQFSWTFNKDILARGVREHARYEKIKMSIKNAIGGQPLEMATILLEKRLELEHGVLYYRVIEKPEKPYPEHINAIFARMKRVAVIDDHEFFTDK